MDELLSQFNTTALNPDDEENNTGFEGMYKNWGKLGNQEQRRKDILDAQRSSRNSKIDTCRGILDTIHGGAAPKEIYRKPQPDSRYRPSIYVAGFTKASSNYRDVLMMSEWLVDKPTDFSDNWYVVPCPKGVRTLLVACQGITKLYTKYGSFRLSTRTALPGGNPCDHNSSNHCVILDCFHVESLNTLYVLDLLAWNNQPMSDGETEFRHYWMKTHIEDIPELKMITKKNKILIEILPKVDCDRESFNEFMATLPHFKDHSPTLDGLLFYHKLAHYVAGVTPLVGWLYPFMVNEVLGSEITVNPGYLVGRPIDYVDQAHFIEEFESKMKKKVPSFARDRTSMDTSTEGEQISQEGRRRQQISGRSNTDAEMEERTELEGWQPTTTTYQLWPQTNSIPAFPTSILPLVTTQSLCEEIE